MLKVSRSLENYSALPNPIEDEGPWALESNPNQNYYTGRKNDILFIVLHITDGVHDEVGADASAESTTNYGASTSVKVSWHVCIDSDSIIPCLRDSRTSWAQGVPGYNFNSPALSVEIGTKGTNWNAKSDAWVESTLKNVVAWCAPRVKEYGIPLVHVKDREAVQDGVNNGTKVGFVSHATLSTNRTDPGVYNGVDTFPWERFFELLRKEVGLMANATIKLGASGDLVVELQKLLNDLLYDVGVADGKFGPATQKGLKEFQEAKGLDADGVAGPITWSALYEASKPAETPVPEEPRPGQESEEIISLIKGELKSIEHIFHTELARFSDEVSLVRQDVAKVQTEVEEIKVLVNKDDNSTYSIRLEKD